MMREPESIRDTASLWDGLVVLADRGYRTLPICTADGTYVDALTRAHIIKALLPTAATMKRGLGDLSFVHSDVDQMIRRIGAERDLPLADAVRRFHVHVPTVRPSTSIMQAIRLLYDSGLSLPVLDDDRRLVGLVTGHGMVRALVAATDE